MTSTVTGPFCESSLRPSCSCSAVKIDGPFGSAGAAPARPAAAAASDPASTSASRRSCRSDRSCPGRCGRRTWRGCSRTVAAARRPSRGCPCRSGCRTAAARPTAAVRAVEAAACRGRARPRTPRCSRLPTFSGQDQACRRCGRRRAHKSAVPAFRRARPAGTARRAASGSSTGSGSDPCDRDWASRVACRLLLSRRCRSVPN